MRVPALLWLLLAAPFCTPDTSREEYLRSERQRQALAAANRAMDLEARLVDSGRAYLVFDLGRREVRALVGGVPLRSAGIAWWARKPQAEACCGAYRLRAGAREVEYGPPDSAAAARLAAARRAGVRDSSRAKSDSTKAPRSDSAKAAVPQAGRNEAPVDALANVASLRLALDDKVSLWLHGEYPRATGLDSLRERARTWVHILPNLARTDDYHLFLPAPEIGWIQTVAGDSTWVLVLDCEAWVRATAGGWRSPRRRLRRRRARHGPTGPAHGRERQSGSSTAVG